RPGAKHAEVSTRAFIIFCQNVLRFFIKNSCTIMKNIRLFISLFIALLVLSVQGVWAQDCFGVQIKDGSGFEMTTLNAKGKPEGVVKYRFAKVRQEGAYTVVDVQVEGISSKGKQEYATTYLMK